MTIARTGAAAHRQTYPSSCRRSLLHREQRGARARRHACLGVDVLHVVLGGAPREDEVGPRSPGSSGRAQTSRSTSIWPVREAGRPGMPPGGRGACRRRRSPRRRDRVIATGRRAGGSARRRPPGCVRGAVRAPLGHLRDRRRRREQARAGGIATARTSGDSRSVEPLRGASRRLGEERRERRAAATMRSLW